MTTRHWAQGEEYPAWSGWADRAERAARDLRRGRGPGHDSHIRASDAERAAVADELSAHYGAGRLDRAEFDERMTRVMSAKTRGELPPLLADLPSTAPVPAPPRRRRRSALITALLLVVILLTGVAAAHAVAHLAVNAWLPVTVALLVLLTLRHRHRRHG